MARPPRIDSRLDQAEEAKNQKRYRLELTLKQMVLSCAGLLVVLSWMFAFGILVGRGFPLVSSKDFSIRAQFVRFLGLGREVALPPQNVAETWEDPKKMLEALNYYQDLTQKGPGGTLASAPTPAKTAPTPLVPVTAQKKTAAEPSSPPPNQAQGPTPNPPQKPKPSAPDKPASVQPAPGQPASEHPVVAEHPKTPPKKTPPPAAVPADSGAEHFTLLIASLRDTEKAQHLVDQLRSKGHTARIEALNLNESERWNRVLVGTFRNRDEALRFAADFNRKEHTEGLVIREVQ